MATKKARTPLRRIIAVTLSVSMLLSMVVLAPLNAGAADFRNLFDISGKSQQNSDTPEQPDVRAGSPLGASTDYTSVDKTIPLSEDVILSSANTVAVEIYRVLETAFKFTLTEEALLFFNSGGAYLSLRTSDEFTGAPWSDAEYGGGSFFASLQAGTYWLYVDDDGYFDDYGVDLETTISVTPVSYPQFDRGSYHLANRYKAEALALDHLISQAFLDNFNDVFSDYSYSGPALTLNGTVGGAAAAANSIAADIIDDFDSDLEPLPFTADTPALSLVDFIITLFLADAGIDFSGLETHDQLVAAFLIAYFSDIGFNFGPEAPASLNEPIIPGAFSFDYTLGDSLDSAAKAVSDIFSDWLGDLSLDGLIPSAIGLYLEVPEVGDGTLKLSDLPFAGDGLTSATYGDIGDYEGTEIANPEIGSEFPIHVGKQQVTLVYGANDFVFKVLVDVLDEDFENPFKDVKPSDWYYSFVLYIYRHGLMKGTSDTTFGSYDAKTRGMLVTVLAKLSEVEMLTISKSSFNDVEPSAYYASPIEWAKANKIVAGIGEGKFAPNASIARQDLALILYRYAQWKGVELKKIYAKANFADDAEIAGYAKEAVYALQQAGIIAGKSNNLFDPNGTATRAEFATMLYRFIIAMTPNP
ncbi:MAG: S-layer homology domain-containing protein [Oscillospiraceae bacterium]|jgi:hypothetical protein|nr:S-layer homology domain-containing protein [Oscillospiraceae bacterium]